MASRCVLRSIDVAKNAGIARHSAMHTLTLMSGARLAIRFLFAPSMGDADMFASWFALPDEVMEDPWFTPDRLWRLAWISKNVLRSNNCIAKKGQISKPLRVLAEAWSCSIKVVRTTLSGLEKRGMVRVSFGKVKGKVQTVISCLFSKFYDESEIEKGTERARKGHGEGHIYKEDKNLRSKKEDSLRTSSSESVGPRGLRMPPVEPDGGDNGADPSPTSLGRESESTPHTESGGGTTSGGKKPKSPPKGYCSEFEEFWQACPLRRGSKFKAYQSWWKQPEIERSSILEGARAWKRNSIGKDAKYVAHVTTWLNGRRWETEVNAANEEELADRSQYWI